MTPPCFSLGGRTILITGASGALGGAIAEACAGAGARLVLTGRDTDRLSALAARLPAPEGTPHLVLAADLLVESAIAALVAATPELDGVVVASGAAHQRLARQETPAGLRSMLALNLEAPITLVQALWKGKRLRPGASVVLVGSVAGVVGAAAHASYGAAKSGLSGWVRAAAIEGRASRLRFNCLCPGLVRSPMADSAAASTGEEAVAAWAEAAPLGLGEPSDVAGAALFLLSPASRWITGTNLVVDGGFSAR